MTGPSKGTISHPRPAKLVLTGSAPSLLLREYVTMEHLWTARHAARLCSEGEPQLQPNDLDAEHRSLVITAVFFAAAFLEALVNEVIHDVAYPPNGGPSPRVAGIPVNGTTIAAFRKVSKNKRIQGGTIRSTMGKYQEALDAAGKSNRHFDETRDPFKSAQLLFKLRNHFVHFKPKTQDIAAGHDFEKALKKAKVVENQQSIGEPWFPNKALGAGLAQWACDSSARFAKSWWSRMGLRSSYDASFDQLGPY